MDTIFDSMQYVTLINLDVETIKITLQCGRCGADCRKPLTVYMQNDRGHVDCSHCEENGFKNIRPMKLVEMQVRY